MNTHYQKHASPLPSVRKIRRACSKELYRTIKRLNIWITPEKIEAAEKLYVQKVASNLLWIVENQSNKKAQADWWEEHVSEEIASLWEVDRTQLCQAFRHAYGG